jgi:hypothetical protein
MNNCTSHPDCPCAFCILSRTQRSARDEERQLAEPYLEAFCRHRDREMDAEAARFGKFGTYPGELAEVA